MVRSPEDYSRIWIETLDLLNDEGLLDIVVWVDLCNEFLFPRWCPVPFKEITGAEPDNFLGSILALLADWKGKRKLPLITTEAWASIQYEDITQYGFGGEWDWF